MTTSMRPRFVVGSAASPFEHMERALSDWFGWAPEKNGDLTLTPAMDVHEDDERLTVSMELPGIAKDQIEVTLENGVLTVAGEKKVERTKEGKRFYAVERRSGSFRRSVTLPTDVDVEKADASFENGVLTIQVPKTEAVKPKRLMVS